MGGSGFPCPDWASCANNGTDRNVKQATTIIKTKNTMQLLIGYSSIKVQMGIVLKCRTRINGSKGPVILRDKTSSGVTSEVDQFEPNPDQSAA